MDGTIANLYGMSQSLLSMVCNENDNEAHFKADVSILTKHGMQHTKASDGFESW